MHYTTSCNTQSGAPEDGRNYRPKHVEQIGIINKPLLLHPVGCLYYLQPVFRLFTHFLYDEPNHVHIAEFSVGFAQNGG